MGILTESQNRTSSTWAASLFVRTATIAVTAGFLCFTTTTSAQSPDSKKPSYSVLYTFTGGADGAAPLGGNLILDPMGNLYGTTGFGGDLSCSEGNPPGCGVVFKVDRMGKETVLHTFTGGSDGIFSVSGLVRDEAGNLYGNTCSGGSAGQGVLFKLDKAGKETILHTFTGGADGGCPGYGILRDEEGNLYATASSGGDLSRCAGYGCGVVFKVDRTGKETVLYTFTGGSDGLEPNDMIRDEEGNLYGTTVGGGDPSFCNGYGCGVVFKVDRAGKETVLYSFTGGADGSSPGASVVRDKVGNLYGTTSQGGINSSECQGGGCGVVFKLDRAGKETVLYSFTGATDGGTPFSDLIRDDDGNLYGTASSGGERGCLGGGFYCGVVFEVDQTGKETVLHTFTGGTDGGYILDGLVRDIEGNLYGATGYGGNLSDCRGDGCGVVFKIAVPKACDSQAPELSSAWVDCPVADDSSKNGGG